MVKTAIVLVSIMIAGTLLGMAWSLGAVPQVCLDAARFGIDAMSAGPRCEPGQLEPADGPLTPGYQEGPNILTDR